MVRMTITMEDLRDSEGISCLNDMLNVVSKTVAEQRRLEELKRERALTAKERHRLSVLEVRKVTALDHVTDELLANDYAPDVWAYVGEVLNKLN